MAQGILVEEREELLEEYVRWYECRQEPSIGAIYVDDPEIQRHFAGLHLT